jgi:hypothetical protein
MNATELERTLLRSGDDIYRLALLLCGDESGAAHALIKAIRRLSTSGSAPNQAALLVALLAVLPAERRRWRQHRLPAWAQSRAVPAGRAELLVALVALPRAQRFALGLTMLHSFESADAAALLGDEGSGSPGRSIPFDSAQGRRRDSAAVESSVANRSEQVGTDRPRVLVRDALLTLAPIAIPTIPMAALDSASTPEDCRPTRAAIALNDPALHNDATIRGHLALCSACRAAEHAWHALRVAVEEALRGALRDTRLPPALADQLQIASQPAPASGWALLANPRVRLALVALPVLALIAFLVWPRGVPPVPTASAPALAQAPAARELVQRAREQLYIPPAGQGTWHGRYEVQWAFADATTALLAGDVWIDSASGRHRIQLVHHSGGGPYEFELADGVGSARYAASGNYQPSLSPLLYHVVNRVQVEATPAAQLDMLAARLQSGAWGLAADYLRQAATAELRTWGRQRAVDGALLDLVSFNGISPLALPADAPNATTSRVTVLLAIDEASGRLREVRELIGPAGSEQTTRTTWRQVSEEWIQGDQALNRVFAPREAWNGVGDFTAVGKLVDPALPLVRPEAVTALVQGYQLGWTGLWMPASAPPGTSSAFLLNSGQPPLRDNQIDPSTWLTLIYLAPGRRLEISTTPNVGAIPPLYGGEIVSINQRQASILPSNGQRYEAQINHNLGNAFDNPAYTTQVAALGYTRAELLDVLRALGPPTLASYLAQARLFADPGQHDPAAFDALLTALTPPPAGEARHFVEHVYKRQDQQPDALLDPYHRPRYGGWPERLIQENWARGEDNPSTVERAATTTGADGTIYGRQYLGPDRVWYYNARLSRVEGYSGALIGYEQRMNEDQHTLLRLIACGGSTLQTSANGMRAIVLTEQDWRNGGSCVHPEYGQFFYAQNSNDPNSDPDQTPYLADRSEVELTTLVGLNAAGRDVSIQVWAGQPATGTLLQSWELVSDEVLPAARVPAATFDSTMPTALQRWTFTGDYARPAPFSVTITQALALAQTPLFELSTTPDEPETSAITSTSQVTLTNTPRPTPLFLNSIIAGPPPDAPGARPMIEDQPVFDQALYDGFAIRFSYTLTTADGSNQTINLYQGSAQTLGAYLRASAVWQNSSAETFQIGGQPVSGWRIIERRTNAEWLLFELDGTLIAAQPPSDALLAALGQLRRVTGDGVTR